MHFIIFDYILKSAQLIPNQIKRTTWSSSRKKCSLTLRIHTVGREGAAHTLFCNLLSYHGTVILNTKPLQSFEHFEQLLKLVYLQVCIWAFWNLPSASPGGTQCSFSASANTGHHPQTISSSSKTVLEISFCNFFLAHLHFIL